jgi:hypothetical protein
MAREEEYELIEVLEEEPAELPGELADPAAIDAWVERALGEKKPPASSEPEVALVVSVGPVRIEVRRGFSPETLAAVLGVVRA